MRLFLTLIMCLCVGLSVQALAQIHPIDDNESQAQNDVPIEFIIEAEDFLAECDSNPKYTEYYNCDCMAAYYLDERLKSPFLEKDVILMNIQGSCMDATAAAGSLYLNCLTNGTIFPEGTDPTQYCACFAREFGSVLEKEGQAPNTRVLTAAQSYAHSQCR